MDEQMFCFQCEQAAGCTACTGAAGVCGKSAETAAAQDRLTGALIAFAGQLIAAGRGPAPEQARLLMQGLFTTITNVNFDPAAVDALTRRVHDASPGTGPDYDMQALWREPDADRRSLKCFVLFSLRGMAAYNYHARVLGRIDPELDRFFCTALQAVGDPGQTTDALWQLVQATGEASYRCMELLDAANTGAFGQPEPVEVPLVIEKGPFIVISGHDLYDMKCLLEQTAGKGINVYTHSEMLPAHGYPELKQKYPHLKGNFGTAWQNQQREFEDIPAPILFTTNCIMPLRASYADRVFTTSVVAYPGVPHIDEGRDFSPVIEKALELGYDGIATGHYARVERESGRFLLRRAADRAKDQTYMLCKLTQAQLARTLFPLGGVVSKEETRRLAQEAGLTLARKHDSQDICFVPDGDYMAYLTANGLVPQAGHFVTPDGRVLGPHRGLEAYTVGQRRGLGMAFGERVYVLGKRGTDVVVGEERLLFSRRVEVGDVNYVPYDRPPGPLRVEAALRYTARTAPAWLYPDGPACTLLFDEPQRAATEGQTAVFYDGETVVGGGTIRAAESGLRNLNETEGIEK